MQNHRMGLMFKAAQCKITLFFLVFIVLLSACAKEEAEPIEPPAPEPTVEPSIIIAKINNIPANVTFDRVEANITGECWSNIGTVKAKYENGCAIIILPTDFTAEQLQIVDRRDNNMCGHWPATSDNPDALVATLGDIIAYHGDDKVGRVYSTNWPGKGSSAGKAFVYYQYADRPFSLTGRNNSYYYSDCTFSKGWNGYVNINPASEETSGNIHCTTSIPNDIFWNFESWVY